MFGNNHFVLNIFSTMTTYHVFSETRYINKCFFTVDAAQSYLDSLEDSEDWDIYELDEECPF